MRRSYNSDARTTDGLEVTRRLYRGVTDIAKRLDEQKSHALTVSDIFTPTGEALRAKLRDYCERLIFKDPISHVRKTEELLWRRGFYDVVSMAKKIRKGNVWSEAEKALLSAHLSVGVGFYHHLILRLQIECNLDLVGVIDFAYPHNESTSANIKSKSTPSKLQTEEVRQCAIRFIHRSLICLGDLARYRLDLEPNWDPMIATRYYKMAVAIDPNIGMPHNQLGTMAGNKNFGLDGVYHYMRCILCTEPFDGAEGNLKRTVTLHSFSGKEKCPTQECIAKLLSLLQLWECEDTNPDRINQECQALLNVIETCLTLERSFPSNKKPLEDVDDIETYLQSCKIEDNIYLNDDMIFKIMSICLMTISKLRNKDSCDVQGVIAFTLAVLSQLVHSTILRIQESLIDISITNGEHVDLNLHFSDFESELIKEEEEISAKEETSNVLESLGLSEKNERETNGHHINGVKSSKDKSKSLLTKLRRRKRRNSSDSDNSDADGNDVFSSSDEMNSDISETEEDALSGENPHSDEALSDDLSDEEGPKDDLKSENANDIHINGHDLANSRNTSDNADVLENGKDVSDDQADIKFNDKSSTTNSGSVITLTPNVDSSSVYEESSGSTNTIAYVAQLKKQSLDQNVILDVLASEGILASVKLCCDWLKCNPEIIKTCSKGSRTLMKRITTLLNLTNIDWNLAKNGEEHSVFLSRIDNLEEAVAKVPLPEDVNLRGMKDLEEAHKDLDWKLLRRFKIDRKERTLLRSLKLMQFGRYLSSIEDLRLSYNEETKMFVMDDSDNLVSIGGGEKEGKKADVDHPRGKLMRHMGRLWLKAEVRALESRLRSRLMSPYLVPDHEALAKHTPALKRLVYAKKFIIVIPAVVVSALDEVKRTSAQAREATRWLEGQLRRGSRFLRAQRPHERLPIPLIKGPRSKDKEAWLYFQIIECCHYLTQQSKVGLTSDSEIPVVTLLTGCSAEDQKTLTVSPEGLAKSAGVNLEHIEAFHTKWKASSKSHG
ncbi:protein SMG5 [Belonocnema kinseyi]|uniref:protein SMG5 n=1 Tax=Belonocnema kinseyi TaxID=2817044 RepID=UPI00143D9BC1|nr:protein SMG5 [Belonocnema kinseyi]